jgi:hypothetical protein
MQYKMVEKPAKFSPSVGEEVHIRRATGATHGLAEGIAMMFEP